MEGTSAAATSSCCISVALGDGGKSSLFSSTEDLGDFVGSGWNDEGSGVF